MKTIAVEIINLCAPCGCACRYCLLRSDKRAADGVPYERGLALAKRFAEWGRGRDLAELPSYYVGYCQEFPQLFENLAWNRALGAACARFFQANGIRIRDEAETDDFCGRLAEAGVGHIDTTFYGGEAYHDRFAGRPGDYAFLLRLGKAAKRHGIVWEPTVPVTRENAPMLEALYDLLRASGADRIYGMLPDYRGRGDLLEPARLTRTDPDALPSQVRDSISLSRYRSEGEWLRSGPLPAYTRRALNIVTRRDNIEMLEGMSCDEIVSYVEGLDDAYYAAIPDINALAALYGDPAGEKLYRLRDLFWMWQRRWIREHGLQLHDVTDERQCSTVRS